MAPCVDPCCRWPRPGPNARAISIEKSRRPQAPPRRNEKAWGYNQKPGTYAADDVVERRFVVASYDNKAHSGNNILNDRSTVCPPTANQTVGMAR